MIHCESHNLPMPNVLSDIHSSMPVLTQCTDLLPRRRLRHSIGNTSGMAIDILPKPNESHSIKDGRYSSNIICRSVSIRVAASILETETSKNHSGDRNSLTYKSTYYNSNNNKDKKCCNGIKTRDTLKSNDKICKEIVSPPAKADNVNPAKFMKKSKSLYKTLMKQKLKLHFWSLKTTSPIKVLESKSKQKRKLNETNKEFQPLKLQNISPKKQTQKPSIGRVITTQAVKRDQNKDSGGEMMISRAVAKIIEMNPYLQRKFAVPRRLRNTLD